MDATRFDPIAKRFADRRLCRPQALGHGGTNHAAGALAAGGDIARFGVRRPHACYLHD